ncbi:MAG: hypothetical protein BRD46_00380 [Bacteroidetes bacterium QS_8_68_15]|nr:MAG: hypothetical protein BRD46_00380 [Bacteroidetes bacterium QS_8_68_15]
MASLIEDLARRLDIPPGQAEQHLAELFDRLREHARHTGEFPLPELGVFTHRDGAWTFEPTETLARSVNRSFADLQPIAVSTSAETDAPSSSATPASDPSTPPESVDSGSGSIFDQPQEAGAEPRGQSSRGLFAPERSSADDDKASTQEKDSRRLPEDDSSLEEAAGYPASAPPFPAGERDYAALPAGYLVYRFAAPSALDDATLEPLASPAPARAGEPPAGADPESDAGRTESARSQREAHRRQRSDRNGRSWTRWGAALLALLLLGIGAWYLVGGQDGGAPEASVARQEGDAPTETAAPPPAGSTPDGEAGGAASDDTTGAESAPSSPGRRAFAEADRLDRAQGGWTVVVTSKTSRAEAKQVARRFAQRFRDADHPIDILETTVDGTPRFRVVVGQFSSSDQALQLIEQDTSRLPADAWGLEMGS